MYAHLLGLNILFACLLCSILCSTQHRIIRCHNKNGEPQRCIPPFGNAAYGLPVEATNTCGEDSISQYCLQTGATGVTQSCQACDHRVAQFAHPAQHLTDFNRQHNYTWWQSDTMEQDIIQYPNTVNLTINLGKSFDITYVKIQFYSSRPESFAIYKRTSADSEWLPYQFYSATCDGTYNMATNQPIRRSNEVLAFCTNKYSDISPLTLGVIPFSTLEERPSAYDFDNSPELQEWVTATDIRIVLTRLNTFGDEVFQDLRVLKSYFYAVSDLAIGATCKCNGHANRCLKNQQGQLECECQHNTTGRDCDRCLPLFNDRPWGRATSDDALICMVCDCNGLSNECVFDGDLYKESGRGGRCLDCRHNTGGPHCDQCLAEHYLKRPEKYCTPCRCNAVGSVNLQCDGTGQCSCKPGVGGKQCDRCLRDYYQFDMYGCKKCGCNAPGCRDKNTPCTPEDGRCTCKDNVEGRQCDACKPGYFGMMAENPYGCLACFCYGHSSDCEASMGLYASTLASDFAADDDQWTAINRGNRLVKTRFNPIVKNLGVSATGRETVYFNAPARYLGDQRFSYDQYITFTLSIGDTEARASIEDILIEGTNGQKISAPIFGQRNPLPGVQAQKFRFRLHNHPDYRWSPKLNAAAFITVLSNITRLKIRGSYSADGVGFLTDFSLETARHGLNGGEEARWVEQCRCPLGYVGQFCESCKSGYTHDPPGVNTPFSKCVPCMCNGHADECDIDTGRCICHHNTVGDHCERCATGYYGNAIDGTEADCQACPCPGGGECIEIGGAVVCTRCMEGYVGNRCELCADGYYSDGEGVCKKCVCSDNIDLNAVGNCNSTSGECYKCIFNTGGFNCESCLAGYYGDAIALPKGQCVACNCHSLGSVGGRDVSMVSCEQGEGNCPCLPNVLGQQCDECRPGYWNIASGTGCDDCGCDRIGSTNVTCSVDDGQCSCRTGIVGRSCDHCEVNHFGFSLEGCQRCSCDIYGSLDLQCDDRGYCPCKPNVVGRNCDQCALNKHNMTAGCVDCPPCYSLIEDQVRDHRANLSRLNDTINAAITDPSRFDNAEFLKRLGAVNQTVITLLNDARARDGGDGQVGVIINALRDDISAMRQKLVSLTQQMSDLWSATHQHSADITTTGEAIMNAERLLDDAAKYLDGVGAETLTRARDTMKIFGDQSGDMKRIAEEAILLAKLQEKDAVYMEGMANDALNTSNIALNTVKEALLMPNDLMTDVSTLKQQYRSAEKLFENTNYLAQQAQEQAYKAYDNSLRFLTDVQSVDTKSLNVDGLGDQAEQIKLRAAQMKRDTKKLLADNADLMDGVARDKRAAERLLQDGVTQQQSLDELLADVDKAREKARKAVKLGEEILNKANKTLRTLLHFNERVRESKAGATEALKLAPDIEATIQEAEVKTGRAFEALSGAQSDSLHALNLAKQAESLATNASKDASVIREEANKTKEVAQTLRDNAVQLGTEVKAEDEEVSGLADIGETDYNLGEKAVSAATLASKEAKTASQNIGNALKSVNDIIASLEGLSSVNETELQRLEALMDKSEAELNESDVDGMHKKMEVTIESQQETVEGYRTDLTELRASVANIRDIIDTLPKGCFTGIYNEEG